MIRTYTIAFVTVLALAVSAGPSPAQVIVTGPPVPIATTASYYPPVAMPVVSPPVVAAYYPLAVSYYAPAPVVSYYTPARVVTGYTPVVAYSAPTVSYYTTPPTVTYRYPLLRPNTVIARYHPGTVTPVITPPAPLVSYYPTTVWVP